MPAPPSPDQPTFFRQEHPNTCALACLRMVLSAYRIVRSEEELVQLAQIDEFGAELSELVRVAHSVGFDCEAKELEFAELPRYCLPIVYLDGPTLGREFLMHAVVVEETATSVKVLDPSIGAVEMDKTLFCTAWDSAGNYAVIVQPKATSAE